MANIVDVMKKLKTEIKNTEGKIEQHILSFEDMSKSIETAQEKQIDTNVDQVKKLRELTREVDKIVRKIQKVPTDAIKTTPVVSPPTPPPRLS